MDSPDTHMKKALLYFSVAGQPCAFFTLWSPAVGDALMAHLYPLPWGFKGSALHVALTGSFAYKSPTMQPGLSDPAPAARDSHPPGKVPFGRSGITIMSRQVHILYDALLNDSTIRVLLFWSLCIWKHSET